MRWVEGVRERTLLIECVEECVCYHISWVVEEMGGVE